MSEFTALLCAAHDLDRPPADGTERVTRDEVTNYIDAFTIDRRPNHPTSAIAWDLQRTFGESDGRRMLLHASRQWDATPIRARDVVHMWWDDDHEPQPWRDEYLIDVIRDWRSERDRLQLGADAEKAWLAFDGAATLQQLGDWRAKFGGWYLDPTRRLGPVKIIKADNVVPFPSSESLREAAQAELDAFKGVVTQAESDAWFAKYRTVASEMKRTNVQIIPNDIAVQQMRQQAVAAKPLRTISAASFAGKAAPEREELVAGLIPAKIIGGLYGDGAVGKSLLALMLGVAVSTGRPWLNRIVKKGPVVYVCCEDDEAEVHRRLENICREMGIDMATLGDFHIVPLADEDSVLASSDGRSNVLTTTPLYQQLVDLTGDVRPQLLIGDTLNDIFAGSENDRMQAKQFIKIMRPLVIPHGGTGLILAHPSVDGMRSGRGTSGTTGWNNSFRWRGYLDKVLDETGNEPDPTRRVLRTKKLNYGPQGGEIELRYQNGCYSLGWQESTMGDPMARASRADRVFLELLRKHIEQNNHVSVHQRGGCYAPKVFAREAAKQGVTRAELIEAMQRLIDSHRIENAPFGAPSKNQFRLHVEKS